MASYTLIAKYAKTIAKCKKQKVHSKVFHVTFFAFHAPFFAFRILQHFTPGSAFAQKVKGFRGLFFHGINKIQNSQEIWKCIVGVSYFVVCFVKTFVKYKKCIARLRDKNKGVLQNLHNFNIESATGPQNLKNTNWNSNFSEKINPLWTF